MAVFDHSLPSELLHNHLIKIDRLNISNFYLKLYIVLIYTRISVDFHYEES
jgi:hypothetical protein